jgi:hypothetical protein
MKGFTPGYSKHLYYDTFYMLANVLDAYVYNAYNAKCNNGVVVTAAAANRKNIIQRTQDIRIILQSIINP